MFKSLLFVCSLLAVAINGKKHHHHHYRPKNVSLMDPTKIDLPVTYYLGQIGLAYVGVDQYLYYEIILCKPAIADAQYATLAISLPTNVEWQNLDRDGFVMVQVSICQNSFTSSCVIAQNYLWGSVVIAVPKITWKIGTEQVYYIRLLAGNIPIQFSLELSFEDNMNPSHYNWTTNYPFEGNTVSKSPTKMQQYWKSVAEYTVKNKEKAYFALAYCNQGPFINGIEVAAITPITKPYSLITQYACPQSYANYTQCTQPVAVESGWVNTRVASFNLLRCENSGSKDTSHGIWVVVEGDGGEPDEINYFSLQATIII